MELQLSFHISICSLFPSCCISNGTNPIAKKVEPSGYISWFAFPVCHGPLVLFPFSFFLIDSLRILPKPGTKCSSTGSILLWSTHNWVHQTLQSLNSSRVGDSLGSLGREGRWGRVSPCQLKPRVHFNYSPHYPMPHYLVTRLSWNGFYFSKDLKDILAGNCLKMTSEINGGML